MYLMKQGMIELSRIHDTSIGRKIWDSCTTLVQIYLNQVTKFAKRLFSRDLGWWG